MNTLRILAAKAVAVCNKPRVKHYLEIFASAFVMTLLYERENILGAHGLNALGAVALAASVAGGKAVFEALRKSLLARFTKPTPTP